MSLKSMGFKVYVDPYGFGESAIRLTREKNYVNAGKAELIEHRKNKENKSLIMLYMIFLHFLKISLKNVKKMIALLKTHLKKDLLLRYLTYLKEIS